MRALHHQLSSLRTAARLVRARIAPARPGLVRPARLVFRLDPCGLPGWGADAEPASLEDLQRSLSEAVRWRGALPVTVLTARPAADERAAELARFAHRLECPTTLQCAPVGIDAAVALRLVDTGAPTVVVVLDGDAEALQGAVRALDAARANRRSGPRLEVDIPWTPQNAPLAASVAGWARRSGVQAVRMSAPSTGVHADRTEASLAAAREAAGPVDATPADLADALTQLPPADLPGAPRRGGTCPVGGQRLEITSTGTLCACPFKAPIPAAASLPDAWSGAADHLRAIRTCDRACAHPELRPAGGLL